jgi:hypothetical protein
VRLEHAHAGDDDRGNEHHGLEHCFEIGAGLFES